MNADLLFTSDLYRNMMELSKLMNENILNRRVYLFLYYYYFIYLFFFLMFLIDVRSGKKNESKHNIK